MTPARSRSPGGRRRPCRVCQLPASERDLITGGLLSGWSARSLSARFASVTRRDVQGHMQCVKNKEEDEC